MSMMRKRHKHRPHGLSLVVSSTIFLLYRGNSEDFPSLLRAHVPEEATSSNYNALSSGKTEYGMIRHKVGDGFNFFFG